METEQIAAEEYREYPGGMTSSTLKWIAIITMLIDHIGASLLEWYLVYLPMGPLKSGLRQADVIIRCIGRLAFPLFIFLLVEGFFFTRSRRKYCGRLLLFAAISEFPFDLAFFLRASDLQKQVWWRFDHQNVFFTLVIGFLAIWCIETLRPKEWEGKRLSGLLRIVLCSAVAWAGLWLANRLHTDYSWKGVLAIELAYLVRLWGRRDLEIFAMLGALLFSGSIELVSVADYFFLKRYRGEKGRTWNKWFFYVFYPAHLLLLGLIRVIFILPK